MDNTHISSFDCSTPEEQETLNDYVSEVFDGMAINIKRGKIDINDFHFCGVDDEDSTDEVIIFVRLHYLGDKET